MLASTPFFSQTDYLAEIKPACRQFADDLAVTLPHLSSVGLNWNEACIGNSPQFTAGMSVGFVTVPYDSMYDLANSPGGLNLST